MSQKTTKTTTPKSTMPKKSNKGQFAKGNTVGEQTRFEKENAAANKYKDEYCDMLIEFFNKPATRIEYKKNYVKGELSSETPIVLPAEYPTFELFAASISVTTKTLQNWCEKHPRFSYYYARAKEIQLGTLTSCAVMGLYNPLYAKFEAVNNHGQKDKTEVDTNVSGSVNTVYDDKDLALIRRVEERLNGKKKK